MRATLPTRQPTSMRGASSRSSRGRSIASCRWRRSSPRSRRSPRRGASVGAGSGAGTDWVLAVVVARDIPGQKGRAALRAPRRGPLSHRRCSDRRANDRGARRPLRAPVKLRRSSGSTTPAARRASLSRRRLRELEETRPLRQRRSRLTNRSRRARPSRRDSRTARGRWPGSHRRTGCQRCAYRRIGEAGALDPPSDLASSGRIDGLRSVSTAKGIDFWWYESDALVRIAEVTCAAPARR